MRKFFITLLSAIGLCSSCHAGDDIKTLEPKQFAKAVKADTRAVLLDVRQPSEYTEGHIANAVNLDWLSESVFNEGMTKLDKSKTYYVYCRSGRRSHAAAVKMKAAGFNVVDMKGGILSWTEQDMPVVK